MQQPAYSAYEVLQGPAFDLLLTYDRAYRGLCWTEITVFDQVCLYDDVGLDQTLNR